MGQILQIKKGRGKLNCLCECQPPSGLGGTNGGDEASNDGRFYHHLYQTVPNTEHKDTDRTLVSPTNDITPPLRAPPPPSHHVRLPLSSPSVFGTEEFGKERLENQMCVFVFKIMAVRFFSRSHSKKKKRKKKKRSFHLP